MGKKFKTWHARCSEKVNSFEQVSRIIKQQRTFVELDELEYDDDSLQNAFQLVLDAINNNKKIALYGDYDVDGTMSCVSWIWFLRSIGYDRFTYYIPNRQTEGYGVHLQALQALVEKEKVELVITMDCGITANKEAQWCKENGVDFLCTDHHEIQLQNMPDCTVLNPKLHPDPIYQQLCGCGITFVLLRKLGEYFQPPRELWVDLLAIAGMATICDMVPLNSVNHRIVRLGVKALRQSNRPILKRLLEFCAIHETSLNEQDVGFRLGPRINAVGRLDHGGKVVRAFIHDEVEPLIEYMDTCNEKRKKIQAHIVDEALAEIKAYKEDPIIFVGGDWHVGVVGIAAAKIVEEFWKPVWLYSKKGQIYRGSARSIPEFDVTASMGSVADYFVSYGGHKGAGGFSFAQDQEENIRNGLCTYANQIKKENSKIWNSFLYYDCEIDVTLLGMKLVDILDDLRPFGFGFSEPKFLIRSKINEVSYYTDKETGAKKHTVVFIKTDNNRKYKIMFFNSVYLELSKSKEALFIVTVSKNYWQGRTFLSLLGADFVLPN